jgi:hypothetical protein
MNHPLPPYYVVKNLVLIASALDDRDDAEMFRLSTEQLYCKTLAYATSSQDQASLELLNEMQELDELIRFRDEDMYEQYGMGFD